MAIQHRNIKLKAISGYESSIIVGFSRQNSDVLGAGIFVSMDTPMSKSYHIFVYIVEILSRNKRKPYR